MRTGNFVILLLSLVLFSGCYSFYGVDADELQDLKENDVVQIKLKSGKYFEIKNIKVVNFTDNKELEFITYSSAQYRIDSTRFLFSLHDIKEIRLQKVDIQKSVLVPVFIGLGVILIYLQSGATIGG